MKTNLKKYRLTTSFAESIAKKPVSLQSIRKNGKDYHISLLTDEVVEALYPNDRLFASQQIFENVAEAKAAAKEEKQKP